MDVLPFALGLPLIINTFIAVSPFPLIMTLSVFFSRQLQPERPGSFSAVSLAPVCIMRIIYIMNFLFYCLVLM